MRKPLKSGVSEVSEVSHGGDPPQTPYTPGGIPFDETTETSETLFINNLERGFGAFRVGFGAEGDLGGNSVKYTLGPCAKVEILARVVAADGKRQWDGTNDVRNPQAACPRGPRPHQRDDYALCQSVCAQPAHAEVAALRAAGPHAWGGTLYVSHHRICEACQRFARRAGVARIVCNAEIL